MVVEELRARIMKLDNEIDLQRKLLKKLERERSLAQGQLNAVLDPMARLPLEISSEIFLQSLAPSACEVQHVPIVLLNICNAWTEIAKATAALWTKIAIHFPCGDGLAEVLPIWFQRASNRALSITISLRGPSGGWNHHVSSVLWKHGERLKYLEILHDDDFASRERDGTVDLLGTTSWLPETSLPSLETLVLRCQHRRRMYFASQTFELIRLAPNIIELVFDKIELDFDPDSDLNENLEKLFAPTLRRLIFEDGFEIDYNNDDVLDFLSLPALETLSLRGYCITGETLLDFIERSGAPLQELALGCYNPHSSVSLHQCLRVIPSLTRFTISDDVSRVIPDLVSALADYPSLLPHLCNLTIHTWPDGRSDLSDSSWKALVRALSARRMQFRMVNVALSPPADFLASLRELVLDGVEIYIGSEERNFIAQSP
ncbi:F-box domain-containing protein [Mycena sanguinolenta]|uniref:F-box domain-containing protein n=1 Tax=Mycena sanguinolenta TaxID=230812 RepID=A0A8H6YM06_9AGAR|nr:F-box domain-containing protein [Mycena sanguinolenta]